MKVKSSKKFQIEDQENLLKRMNRILGQVQGIKAMIEQQRTCNEVLSQIAAVKSALDGVAMVILESEAVKCFQNVVDKNPTNKDLALKEFITLIRKYSK